MDQSKQQTAVEMMLEYLQKHGFDMEYEMELSFLEWEKEQIINAAKIVLFNSTGEGDTAAEQYYNETYGK
jgi:hypothetical protein